MTSCLYVGEQVVRTRKECRSLSVEPRKTHHKSDEKRMRTIHNLCMKSKYSMWSMVAQNYYCSRRSISKSYAAVRRTNGIVLVSRHVCALLRFSNVIGSVLRIQYRLHSCHNEKLLRLIDNMFSNRKNHIQKHCHSHCQLVGQLASNQCCTVSHRFYYHVQ